MEQKLSVKENNKAWHKNVFLNLIQYGDESKEGESELNEKPYNNPTLFQAWLD